MIDMDGNCLACGHPWSSHGRWGCLRMSYGRGKPLEMCECRKEPGFDRDPRVDPDTGPQPIPVSSPPWTQ